MGDISHSHNGLLIIHLEVLLYLLYCATLNFTITLPLSIHYDTKGKDTLRNVKRRNLKEQSGCISQYHEASKAIILAQGGVG